MLKKFLLVALSSAYLFGSDFWQVDFHQGTSIYNIENAKKVYQSAWDALLERKEERQILQIKLESVGVLVDDPEIERPILETQVEETE